MLMATNGNGWVTGLILFTYLDRVVEVVIA